MSDYLNKLDRNELVNECKHLLEEKEKLEARIKQLELQLSIMIKETGYY